VPADTSEVEALARDLERSTNRVGKEAAAAVRKKGRELKDKAQALAPVGPTGDLKESIGVIASKGSGGSGSFSIHVGSKLRYAAFVEYGTGRPTPPQPFMEPALQAVEGGFVKAMEDLGFKALEL
jgi:HK97 gp10 family phage protein